MTKRAWPAQLMDLAIRWERLRMMQVASLGLDLAIRREGLRSYVLE